MGRKKDLPVGRPKLPKGIARTKVISFRVTAKTAAKIERRSRLRGFHSTSAMYQFDAEDLAD